MKKVGVKPIIKNMTIPRRNNMIKNYPASWDLVKADIDERNAFGIKQYGVPLKPFMSRKKKNLKDVYEEALDMVVYFRTMLYEQEGK